MTVDPRSRSTCLSAVSPLAPPGPKWRASHRMSWPTRPLSWMKPSTTISVSVPRTNMESAPLWRLSRLSSPRASLVSVFHNVFTTFSCAVCWCMGATMFGLGWVSLVMYQIVSHFLTRLFSLFYHSRQFIIQCYALGILWVYNRINLSFYLYFIFLCFLLSFLFLCFLMQ